VVPPLPGATRSVQRRRPSPQPPRERRPPQKPAKTLNLEAAHLLPIGRKELKESLEELLKKARFRIGGRGGIRTPDERTVLIDRAL
jgi:hypothetical protein